MQTWFKMWLCAFKYEAIVCWLTTTIYLVASTLDGRKVTLPLVRPFSALRVRSQGDLR